MVRNRTIWDIMCKEQTVVDEIKRRLLVWFEHTKRIENRWLKTDLKRIPLKQRRNEAGETK